MLLIVLGVDLSQRIRWRRNSEERKKTKKSKEKNKEKAKETDEKMGRWKKTKVG